MELEEMDSANTQEEVADTIDKESIRAKNIVVIHKIMDRLAYFAKQDPEEMSKALEIFEATLRKIKTPSEFTYFVENSFGAVRPTAISKRKGISRRRFCSGRRLRPRRKQNRWNLYNRI